MSAPKARLVVEVYHQSMGSAGYDRARVQDENGQQEVVRLDTLDRLTIVRAMSKAFPNDDGRLWHRAPREEMLQALDLGAPLNKWSEPQPEPQPTPQPAVSGNGSGSAGPTANPTGADALAGLAAWIQSVAGESVNEAKVREIVEAATVKQDAIEAIVKTAVDAGLASVRPTVVSVNRQDPVKVTGRTHKAFKRVLDTVGAGQAPFLVGEPGTGKSYVAHQVAEAFGLERVATVACHQQLTVSTFVGYRDANGNEQGTEHTDTWENGGVILYDECDKANANTLGFIQGALSDGVLRLGHRSIKRHHDCIIMAGGNTYGTGATSEYVGSTKLDAAFLDRFTFLPWDRDPKLEREIVYASAPDEAEAWLVTIETVRSNIKTHGLKVLCTMRGAVEGVRLVHQGWSHRDALDARVVRNLDRDQRTKVLEGIAA